MHREWGRCARGDAGATSVSIRGLFQAEEAGNDRGAAWAVQAASGAAAAAAASADEPPPLQVLRLRKLARFYISIADGEYSVERDFAFLREEFQQGPTLGC